MLLIELKRQRLEILVLLIEIRFVIKIYKILIQVILPDLLSRPEKREMVDAP